MKLHDYLGAEIFDSDDVGDNAHVDYDRVIKGVAHRGYSADAPENTLPAYKLARQMGFYYVETDISFTSDNVPVLLHDATIDRTSNGSGNIADMTFEQVREYDFGAWKNAKYAGTKIPSFAEFLALCKARELHPYIEIKSNQAFTQAQIETLVDMVRAYGMQGKVTWISFSDAYLGYVKNHDSKARIGYVVSNITAADITKAQALKTSDNYVFIDGNVSKLTQATIALCYDAELPLEIWTLDSESGITALDPYISGVTSNNLIAGKVLYQANIE